MSAPKLSTLSIQTPDMLRCVVAANDASMSPIVNLGEEETPWHRDDDSPHEPSVAADTDAAATHVDEVALRRVIAFGSNDDDDDLFGPPDAAQGTRPPSPVLGPSATTLRPSPTPAVKHVDAPAVTATETPSKRQRLFACFRPCCAPAAEKATTTCDREVTSHLCNMKQHVVRAIIALTEPLAGASVRAVDVQSRPTRTFQ